MHTKVSLAHLTTRTYAALLYPLQNAVKLSHEMKRKKELEDKRLRALGIEPEVVPQQTLMNAAWE